MKRFVDPRVRTGNDPAVRTIRDLVDEVLRKSRISTFAQGPQQLRNAHGVTPSGESGDVAHSELSDIVADPDNVDDHDGRYYTETEIDDRVLDDVADVEAAAPNDTDVLTWDEDAGGTGIGKWVPAPAGGGSDDKKVKVSTDDTTPGFLEGKIQEDTGITLTVYSPGANEILGVGTNDAEIDHNSLANTHNLTTDIDHDALTNTHNLTTDIDHDALTNTHNLTTDIDHGSISGLGDDDHPKHPNIDGRAGGQSINGGTGSGETLALYGSAHATKGAINLNGNFNVNQAGAHQNNYNGVVVSIPGPVPDIVSVTYGTALPDTNYSLQLTGRWHFYDGMFVIPAEPGMLILNGLYVTTVWHIVTKTTAGFTATPMHTVIDATSTFEPAIGGWSVAPHHGVVLTELVEFYGFTADNDNYTCDWAVRRY